MAQDNTLMLNTSGMNTACSNFKSKVSSIDLTGTDVASLFEPFTSVGVLTSYVSSLKSALASINDNCNSLIGIMKNLVETQRVIDQGTENMGETDYFKEYSGGSGRRGSSSGGKQSTGTNNGNSTIDINDSTAEDPSVRLENGLNEIETYFKSILNGETKITDVAESVTFDILERIIKEKNIELRELITSENNDEINKYVEEISREYLKLFESKNLRADLFAIYNGDITNTISDDFMSSIRNVIDIMADNKGVTVETLLTDDQYESYVKEEISRASAAVSEVKTLITSGIKE